MQERREFEQKKQGVNEDALEYFDTKLQLYLHFYSEGERNIKEFKRQTLNGLRNLQMMKSCLNELSKRTTDWEEIWLIIEDQLTVQRNWNLHPRNPNPDMTGLKEAYWSGNTRQVRIKVNMVTVPVMSTPIIYASASQAPTRTALVIGDCEDTLIALGNSYVCNKKPGDFW